MDGNVLASNHSIVLLLVKTSKKSLQSNGTFEFDIPSPDVYKIPQPKSADVLKNQLLLNIIASVHE